MPVQREQGQHGQSDQNHRSVESLVQLHLQAAVDASPAEVGQPDRTAVDVISPAHPQRRHQAVPQVPPPAVAVAQCVGHDFADNRKVQQPQPPAKPPQRTNCMFRRYVVLAGCGSGVGECDEQAGPPRDRPSKPQVRISPTRQPRWKTSTACPPRSARKAKETQNMLGPVQRSRRVTRTVGLAANGSAIDLRGWALESFEHLVVLRMRTDQNQVIASPSNRPRTRQPRHSLIDGLASRTPELQARVRRIRRHSR